MHAERTKFRKEAILDKNYVIGKYICRNGTPETVI
jgi:hypothetical protein